MTSDVLHAGIHRDFRAAQAGDKAAYGRLNAYLRTGGLILFFLIVEPHGLAQLWRITKEKLRLWPFPY